MDNNDLFLNGSSPAVPSFVAADVVARADEQLSNLERDLAVGDFLPDRMQAQAVAMVRISPEAVRLAVELVKRAGGKIGGLDVAKAERALEYDEAITPIANRARELAARLDAALLANWHGLALSTLAVYGAAQSLDRLTEFRFLRPLVKALGRLVAPPRKAKSPEPADAEPAATEPTDGSAPVAEHPAKPDAANGLHG